jgi:hypothetical protein
MSPPRGFQPPPLFPDDEAEDGQPTRRRQAATSLDAWDRVKPSRRKSYDRILAIVRGRGRFGATVNEIASAMNKVPNAISPRLTELKDADELRLLRDGAGRAVRRDGCGVLVAVD